MTSDITRRCRSGIALAIRVFAAVFLANLLQLMVGDMPLWQTSVVIVGLWVFAFVVWLTEAWAGDLW